MLAIILSTAFAKYYEEYKGTNWEEKPRYAFGRASEHFKAGNLVKASKWFGHAQRSAERAAKILEIDAMLAVLTEKRGQLEQVVREAQEAAAKAEGVRTEVVTISSQIDELTARKNQLMQNIVKQAQQADATAAKVEADVTTGQSSSTPTPEIPTVAPENSILPASPVEQTPPPVVETATVDTGTNTEQPVTGQLPTAPFSPTEPAPAPAMEEPATAPSSPTGPATVAATFDSAGPIESKGQQTVEVPTMSTEPVVQPVS